MLDAYYGERSRENSPVFAAHSLDELYGLVDRLAAAPPVSRRSPGLSGHHAWIILKNVDFSLAAYFGEECRGEGLVDFHLYGPVPPPGPERDWSHPYDGRGLAGVMSTACLKGVMALLDEGRSPLDYVRELAAEAEVVTD